ncbi:MAG: PDDEXK nuclease domain-containing protein [Bacteroidales bacterium]|jgi:predicted nuclease of restriction endonuclease-like (RecB) superfamily|nr:PDDEXK nuclease domain-containing protein [Bacteroidales bacterium]
MPNIIKSDSEYKQWLTDLKLRIRQSQLKAAIKVNSELINLYWSIGKDIIEKQENSKWGDQLIPQLSRDLKQEFPDMKGFSISNLKYIRQWYLFYNEMSIIGQQAVGQLTKQAVSQSENVKSQQVVDRIQIVQQLVAQIPWGHNLRIISNCKSMDEALFYVQKTIENGWSRSILEIHIKQDEYKRSGKSLTNFKRTLPDVHSDLAQETLKDPYNFDFITLTEGYKERELENALTENITRFLLELGAGFAYVGKQYPLHVGNQDFYIDLLFYHLKLRCYVVIELKATDFIPEYAGKLSFYLSAVNDLLKHPSDNPTIGLLICKSKNQIIAEYALNNVNHPIGISEYELTKIFPKDFEGSLPTIEEIEEELEREEE